MNSLQTADCELCGRAAPLRFHVEQYRLYWCMACRHAFVWPQPSPQRAAEVYGDDYFAGDREGGYPHYIAEGPLLRARGRRYASLLSRFAPPSNVLDVGAAAGFLASGLNDGGWRAVGLEPNESMAHYAREQGVNVRVGEIERFSSGEAFDAVVMVQVAAHFYDLRAAFESAATQTRPGGLWLVETWNCSSLAARVFGRSWHAYAPPTALRAFSPRSLDIAAGRAGLTLLARGRAWKPLRAHHARAILARLSRASLAARVAGWFAGFVPGDVVLPYPLGDAFWALYRKP